MTDALSGTNSRVKSLLSLFEKPASQPLSHHKTVGPIRSQRNSYETSKPEVFQFNKDITNAFRPVKSDSEQKEPDVISQLSDKISVKKLIKNYQSLTSPKYDASPSKLGKPHVKSANSIERDLESPNKVPHVDNKSKLSLSASATLEKPLHKKEPVKQSVQEPIKVTAKEHVKVPAKFPVKVPVKGPVKEPVKEPVQEVAKETIPTITEKVDHSKAITALMEEKKSEVKPSLTKKLMEKTASAESSSPIVSVDDDSNEEDLQPKSYSFLPTQLPEHDAVPDDNKESMDGENAEKTDEDDSFDLPEGDDITPLPASYKLLSKTRGHLELILPPPPAKSLIKTSGKSTKNIAFAEENPTFNTYSVLEYDRGDQTVDPVSASAEYEIEKRLDVLDRFEVILDKDSKGLGLSILGVGLGIESGTERLGIFIKSLTPNGVAEKTGKLKVQDQILEVDGISLVGVSQKFAADTLKGTGKSVKMIIGREKKHSAAEEV